MNIMHKMKYERVYYLQCSFVYVLYTYISNSNIVSSYDLLNLTQNLYKLNYGIIIEIKQIMPCMHVHTYIYLYVYISGHEYVHTKTAIYFNVALYICSIILSNNNNSLRMLHITLLEKGKYSACMHHSPTYCTYVSVD